MDDETFEKILEAGGDLFQALDGVLSKYGLDSNHAGSVAIVLVAAMIKGGATTAGKTVDGAAMVMDMWKHDPASGTLLDLRFDPPTRQEN